MAGEPYETIRHIGEAVDVVDDEEQVYSIGLTTTADVTDETFAMIFSVTEPDTDDDGYSLVVEPGQRCAYRCVESCEISLGVLRMALKHAAARDLGLPRELTLSLDLSASEVAELKRGLIRAGIAAS